MLTHILNERWKAQQLPHRVARFPLPVKQKAKDSLDIDKRLELYVRKNLAATRRGLRKVLWIWKLDFAKCSTTQSFCTLFHKTIRKPLLGSAGFVQRECSALENFNLSGSGCFVSLKAAERGGIHGIDLKSPLWNTKKSSNRATAADDDVTFDAILTHANEQDGDRENEGTNE